MPSGAPEEPSDSASQGDEAELRAQLARGFRWLKFSPALEDRFQTDTRQAHGRHLIVCTIIGQISLWINVFNDAQVVPDLAQRLLPIWVMVTLSGLAVFACAWLVPRRRARAWHMDLASSVLPVLITSVLIASSGASAFVMAKVHSANAMLIVMWSCLLARQRFWFALAVSLGTCVAYIAGMHGTGDLAQRIIASNSRILSLSTVFALVANYVLEWRERRSYLLRQLEKQQRKALGEASERLERLSLQDPLTGIHNRRFFDRELASSWQHAASQGQPLALLLLDVDDFKRYNDTYGHPAGDACLKRVADVVQALAQEQGGHAARVGGEEFVLLLPGKALPQAREVGAALCRAVRGAAIEHRQSRVAPVLTISVGAACCTPRAGADPAEADRLMKAADQALYQAKAAGRDRVVCCEADASAETGPSAVSPVPGTNALTPPPEQVEQEAHGQKALRDIRLQLKRGWRPWRFPPWLEAQYQDQRAEGRRWQLFGASIVGILIFNVYLWANRDMTPDVSDWFLLPQRIVSVIVIAAGLFVLRPMSPQRREALFTAAVGLVVASGLLLFGMTREPTVYAGYIALFLIPMFTVVGVGLPFKFSAVIALSTLLGFLATVHAEAPQEKVMALDVTMMMSTITGFILLTSYLLELGERTDFLLGRLSRLQHEALSRTHQALRHLTTLDPLTGLPNRRQFEQDVTRACRCEPGTPISLLLVDVDHFKQFNDELGHPAGDACLQRLAAVLSSVAGEHRGHPARIGGEEFVLLLPGLALAEAVAVGEALCACVKGEAIAHPHAGVVTVSVGAACLPAGPLSDFVDLLARADDALYQAKSLGRDRVGLTAPGDAKSA